MLKQEPLQAAWYENIQEKNEDVNTNSAERIHHVSNEYYHYNEPKNNETCSMYVHVFLSLMVKKYVKAGSQRRFRTKAPLKNSTHFRAGCANYLSTPLGLQKALG